MRPSARIASPGAARFARAANGHAVAGREVHRRDDQVRRLVVAVADAGVVDVALAREVRDCLLVARHRGRDGDSEQAVGPDLGAQRVQDLAREPRAALEGAAVAVARWLRSAEMN